MIFPSTRTNEKDEWKVNTKGSMSDRNWWMWNVICLLNNFQHSNIGEKRVTEEADIFREFKAWSCASSIRVQIRVFGNIKINRSWINLPLGLIKQDVTKSLRDQSLCCPAPYIVSLCWACVERYFTLIEMGPQSGIG